MLFYYSFTAKSKSGGRNSKGGVTRHPLTNYSIFSRFTNWKSEIKSFRKTRTTNSCLRPLQILPKSVVKILRYTQWSLPLMKSLSMEFPLQIGPKRISKVFSKYSPHASPTNAPRMHPNALSEKEFASTEFKISSLAILNSSSSFCDKFWLIFASSFSYKSI